MTLIAHEITGLPVENASRLIVWAHGWRQDRNAWKPLADSLKSSAAHIVVDFPGFGASPLPPENWGTAEYADAMADLIRPYRGVKEIVLVGISFGGRVGIQIASRHPELIDKLFLVASFGIPRSRNMFEKISLKSRVYFFKAMKIFAPMLGMSLDELRSKFGSPDYKAAGALRTVMVRVVSENLTEQAKTIKCPTFLVYGSEDNETPPDIGERLAKLIPNAQLSILPGHDHYTVLTTGRHLVLKRLSDFIGAS